MKHRPQSIGITKQTAVRWFFYATLSLFTAETGWLALTSRYPMAFDEGEHFSMIRFFARHASPLVTAQPSSTYNLGSIAHNPSFLYYWLLAWPYRLVALLSHSLQVQVISLRFINIAFALATLVVLKKLLQLIGLKETLANLVLLLVALTPVVTVLSAQINYDNLMILAATGAMYLAVRCEQRWRRGEFDVSQAAWLLIICLLGSLVKFAFVPIFVGIFAVLGWVLVRQWRRAPGRLWAELKRSAAALSLPAKFFFVTAGMLSMALFGAFYGYNTVRYHNPVPQCNQILTIADCQQYYSWDRNYTLAQHKLPVTMNPLQYTYLWGRSMLYQLFAEIIPTGGLVPIASLYYGLLIGLLVLGTVCVLANVRKILGNRRLMLLLPVALAYLAALWARNYHDYRQLGQAVAIQGRYAVPVIAYFYALLALGVGYALASPKTVIRVVRPALATLVVAAFVYFGGYVRYAAVISPNYSWLPTSRHVARLTKRTG